MQMSLEFGARSEIAEIWSCLRSHFGELEEQPRLEPVEQLVLSLISSRTRDAVSRRAYLRLIATFSKLQNVADASAETIETTIGDVNHPDRKARQLRDALRAVAKTCPDFDLHFLLEMPVEESLRWLQALKGVGPKIAASILNFSTLDRKVFVADTHVLRVLYRLGFLGRRSDAYDAHCLILGAMEDCSAEELAQFHGYLKGLGQTFCQDRSMRCVDCPVSHLCFRNRKGSDRRARR
jgi:endonuclease-3